ncbi:MAG TPA: hypothetical protein VHM24_10115 [Gemmatimonadaceae bacterium]|nr:hypothetical protein [Gemmatimonadaceae bacterium]
MTTALIATCGAPSCDDAIAGEKAGVMQIVKTKTDDIDWYT